MAEKLISKGEFARELSVSASMVTKYVARGLPLVDRKVPVRRAKKWIKDQGFRDRAPRHKGDRPKAKPKPQPSNGKPPTGETRADAERRKEIALADLRELELQAKRGELVDLAAINVYISGMVIRARDLLLSLPGELSDQLADESDAVRVKKTMAAEIERSLRDLAVYQPNGK